MLDYKDIIVAQERFADMRREAARDNRSNELMGGARFSPMQRIASMVARMKRRMERTGAQAQPVGGAVRTKVA